MLYNSFLMVKDKCNTYFGGNQAWCDKKYMQKSGCGVVGCANFILYQRMNTNDFSCNVEKYHISKKNYLQFVEHLRKYYLPVIPGIGMSGIQMSIGINLYFFKNRMKMIARWGCIHWKIWDKIQSMLKQDMPVIMSIGPNFPNTFGRHKLNLYVKNADKYEYCENVNAHYVTVTAIQDEWVEISSWGRKLYFSKKEYEQYVKKHSNWLFSNILVISKF